METPFGSKIDIEKIKEYIERTDPVQIFNDCSTWSYDPTDILSIADIIKQVLKRDSHSIQFYKYGLSQIEDDPSLIADDTNLVGAYSNLGELLIRNDQLKEGIKEFLKADSITESDPIVKFYLSIGYYQLNQIIKSRKYVKELFNISNEEIEKSLSLENINLVSQLKEMLSDPNEVIDILTSSSQESHSIANTNLSNYNFKEAVSAYNSAVSSYEQLLEYSEQILKLPSELIDNVSLNLSNCYLDMGICNLKLDQTHINNSIHCFLKSLKYNNDSQDAIQNLISCMDRVNSFFQFRLGQFKKGTFDEKFLHFYTIGFDALKIPYPKGTSGRDWEKAAHALQIALSHNSNYSFTHHLLGLAYFGLKQYDLAIDEWMITFDLEPSYNFELRSKIQIV